MGKIKCKRAIRRVRNIVTMLANENESVSAVVAQEGAKKGGLKSGLKPVSEMESRQQNYLNKINEVKKVKLEKKIAINNAVAEYNKNRAIEKAKELENKRQAYENRDFNKILKKEKAEKAA